MSEIFPVFEKCPCKLSTIRFKSAQEVVAAMENPAVQSCIEQAKAAIAGQGSVIVRKSGTEPTIKTRVEGEDEALVSRLSDMIAAEIEKCR